MMKFFFLVLSVFMLSSCSGGKYAENQKKLDEMYGACKNPTKTLSKQKYKACLAKERAQGETMFDLAGDVNDLIRGKNRSVVYQNTVNSYLWNAALEMTKSYPLKIADNQGGFLETDWINDPENNLQRCLIKVRVLSQELVSTGVSTNLICEVKQDEVWVSDSKSYVDEEKQLTLKILSTASNLANTSL